MAYGIQQAREIVGIRTGAWALHLCNDAGEAVETRRLCSAKCDATEAEQTARDLLAHDVDMREYPGDHYAISNGPRVMRLEVPR